LALFGAAFFSPFWDDITRFVRMSGGLFSSDQLAQFRGLNQKHLWIKAPLSVKNLTFINHDEKISPIWMKSPMLMKFFAVR
jgi:hypothetical protein